MVRYMETFLIIVGVCAAERRESYYFYFLFCPHSLYTSATPTLIIITTKSTHTHQPSYTPFLIILEQVIFLLQPNICIIMSGFTSLFFWGIAAVLCYSTVKIGSNIYIQYNINTSIPNPMRASRELSASCDAKFEHIQTLYDIHDFATAQKFIQNSEKPLLFKGYVKNSAQKFADMKLDEKLVLFSQVNITAFGNIWLGGLSPVGSTKKTLGEVLNTEADVDATSALYASFQPFVDMDVSAGDTTVPPNVMADTNFVANFPRDVLSTHIHAAPLIESYSVQYLGRKVWIMVSPEDMEAYNPVSSPATYVTRGSEKEFFSKTSPVNIVVQDEGDMLFFPPHWGHAVMTKAGPNVMLNYRVPVLSPYKHRKSLMRFGEALTAALINKLSAFQIGHSHEKDSPINRDLRALGNAERSHGGYDSPCADTWKTMLNHE
jgi:hypothetical protein